MGTENSLAHTKWECKYHIVFAPKYRRQVIYKKIKADVGQILGTLCRRKGIDIQNQLKEDLEYDQMSLFEYIDPFTGEPVRKNKK